MAVGFVLRHHANAVVGLLVYAVGAGRTSGTQQPHYALPRFAGPDGRRDGRYRCGRRAQGTSRPVGANVPNGAACAFEPDVGSFAAGVRCGCLHHDADSGQANSLDRELRAFPRAAATMAVGGCGGYRYSC